MATSLRPHPQQSKLYRTRARFPVVVAGRGSGKTEILKRKIIRALGTRHPLTDTPWFFYGLPTTAQAKRVAWESLKALVPTDWYEPRARGKTFYEADRIIKTRFGSELHVVGLDVPHRIEGNQWCGGVLDESSDQKPGIFDLTVQPALTAFNGWCARSGVPKRYGIGAEDFKKAFDYAVAGTDPEYEAYHWFSSTVVAAAELARIRASLSDRDYNEQYEAQWGSAAGAIFYAFTRALNVTLAAQYNPHARIVVGSDFNVDPMCWTLCHRYTDPMTGTEGLVVFEELMVRNTNTEQTLNLLYQKYGLHPGGWDFCGDASAKARKTSASRTDYVQILNDERFKNKQVYYLKSNPPLVDRFAACNAMLKNAKDLARVKIHPSCTRLIADLEHRAFKPGTKEPADKGDMGHMSDAFGYIITRFWPLQISIDSESSVVITR